MRAAVVAAGALVLALSARAGEVVISLRPDVLLSTPRVTLADVAQVETDDAQLRQAFGGVSLGAAPLAGQVEQRSRAELDLAMRSLSLSRGQRIVWRGAERVRIQSQSQALDGELLLDLARAQVQQRFGAAGQELQLSLAAPLPDLAAPAGALQYRARMVDASRLRPRMPVWIDVMAQGAVYRSVVVPLAVSAYRSVYVAQRALPAGAVATAADFALRREEVADLADAPLAEGALEQGGRLRQPLAVGQVVTVRQIAPAAMVLRGDRVRLVTAVAGIEVETAAYAQADAVVGQQVPVRPERSNDMVTARVMAPGLVRIEGR
ncbi:flagellar basal body P-ring formation chaperone FlgA [Duganella sp. HH101]|uniref:flagellar basal body P-ring formation chaperone FlgA n=1 Tax=Duganella sp. HH101 TaxID=1781066 RepID=UPI000873ACF3|nr:flagellar basal body P-ring formation chaperone FlgA [Duganella sp. HH101]OEZ96668.1 flagellar basal body P-ring biosynthesis protein FlgA [Duganella sp. HH101]